VAGESGGVGQQRGEALYPPLGGDVVDLDAAFDQQFNVAIGQIESQVPAHRNDDHLRREPKAGERRLRRQPRAKAGR
jgi:hypothetical protein